MTDNANSGRERSRRIVVDDTSDAIIYQNSWFSDHGSHNDLGNYGPPLERTLHGIGRRERASFSFTYEGSSIDVYGTVEERFDADWDCIIDGENIGQAGFARPPSDINRWRLCEWNSNDFGNHTLVVQARAGRDPFLFDYVRFIPSPTYQAARSLLQIPDDDPEIIYDAGWNVVGNFTHLTRTPQSSATFSFFGSSLEWYGYTPDEFPLSSSSGSYSIDGAPPVTFEIPGVQSQNDPPQFNRMFFRTARLVTGQHTIKVTYEGNRVPLTLNYLLVESRRDEATLTSTVSPTSVPAATGIGNASSIGAAGRPSPGTIAGAVIGSLLGIGLIILAIFLFRRWHRRRNLPMITPLPGFVKPPASAPLDIDLVSTRMSDEFMDRPGSFPGHARRRSMPRRFNPEVRSTISSVHLNPPPVQHAPPTTTNTETDNHSLIEEVARHRPTSHATSSGPNMQLDPYEAGYPYASMQLADYQKLVEVTKAEEAKKGARARESYM